MRQLHGASSSELAPWSCLPGTGSMESALRRPAPHTRLQGAARASVYVRFCRAERTLAHARLNREKAKLCFAFWIVLLDIAFSLKSNSCFAIWSWLPDPETVLNAAFCAMFCAVFCAAFCVVFRAVFRAACCFWKKQNIVLLFLSTLLLKCGPQLRC